MWKKKIKSLNKSHNNEQNRNSLVKTNKQTQNLCAFQVLIFLDILLVWTEIFVNITSEVFGQFTVADIPNAPCIRYL